MLKPQQEVVAEIIVDLYEFRASTIHPMQKRQLETVHNLMQYNFINSMIAQLLDKYKIPHELIEETLRKRSHKRDLDEIESLPHLNNIKK